MKVAVGKTAGELQALKVVFCQSALWIEILIILALLFLFSKCVVETLLISHLTITSFQYLYVCTSPSTLATPTKPQKPRIYVYSCDHNMHPSNVAYE